jgi:hypothetical protein
MIDWDGGGGGHCIGFPDFSEKVMDFSESRRKRLSRREFALEISFGPRLSVFESLRAGELEVPPGRPNSGECGQIGGTVIDLIYSREQLSPNYQFLVFC